MLLDRKRVEQSGIKSMGDRMQLDKNISSVDPKLFINASKYTDRFVRGMSKGDCTGVLAPTGVGKTSWVLNEKYHILRNNKKGIVILFALEQDAKEIAEKWAKMTVNEPELAYRLYIYTNFEEKENMSITDVRFKLQQLKDVLGEDMISVCIDHLHLLRHSGADYNDVCDAVKRLAKDFNTHIFLISQTQKSNQIIDVPVPRTGCYNCSKFEWNMTYIISLFQPLKRVEAESGLNILGYQFCKIRYKGKNDRTKESMNYLLSFDPDTELLRELNKDELTQFTLYYDRVLELRQNEEKYKSFQFDLSTTVTGKDGREVKLTRIIGGNAAQQED